MITNQRGIALGRMTEADLAAVHARLDALLAREGASVGAYYHCPHDSGACACRKPGTALLERARADLELADLADAYMIGDAPSDAEAERRAGARTIRPGEDAASLAEAVRRLL